MRPEVTAGPRSLTTDGRCCFLCTAVRWPKSRPCATFPEAPVHLLGLQAPKVGNS